MSKHNQSSGMLPNLTGSCNLVRNSSFHTDKRRMKQLQLDEVNVLDVVCMHSRKLAAGD